MTAAANPVVKAGKISAIMSKKRIIIKDLSAFSLKTI
jgi:hypothetical protein